MTCSSYVISLKLCIMESLKIIFVSLLFMVTTTTAHRCNVTHPPPTIDCSGLGLESLPEHLKNHIAIFMKFSHNKLNSTVSFYDWVTLRSVDVSYNLIKNISSTTFKDLINLRVLNVSYNGIENISEDSFDNLLLLEVLDLSGNSIIGSDYLSLQRLLNGTLYRSLKKLVMKSCDLFILPASFFEHAFELQYLDLSHNNLTHIPVFPKSLVYLDMSYNHITTISLLPFHSAHNLRNLYLDYNLKLSVLDTNAFENSKNLRNISFKGCKNLTSLSPHLFYFNNNIKYLSLAGCNLRTLPRQYRHLFLKIPSLELENNPWVCDVSIKWFLSLGSPITETVRCAQPNNNTIMEYYSSNPKHAILRQVLLGLVLTIFILFGVALYMAYSNDQKRRMETPYVPLQGKHLFYNPVYITTVV